MTTIAEEVKDPAKTMPRALISSVGFVSILYLLVASSITMMIPIKDLPLGASFAEAFSVRSENLHWVELVITCAAVVGLSAGIVMNLVSQPRIWMSLARDGLLPEKFSEINQQTGTPLMASFCATAIAAVMGSLCAFETLANMVSLGLLCAYAMVCLAHVRMYIRNAPNARIWLFWNSDNRGCSVSPRFFLIKFIIVSILLGVSVRLTSFGWHLIIHLSLMALCIFALWLKKNLKNISGT